MHLAQHKATGRFQQIAPFQSISWILAPDRVKTENTKGTDAVRLRRALPVTRDIRTKKNSISAGAAFHELPCRGGVFLFPIGSMPFADSR